jgi:hypothetical protein
VASAVIASLQPSARLTGCGKYWYRSIDEVTCGDYYEGFFVNSRKSGIGAYTFSTAKAKYIGRSRFSFAKRHVENTNVAPRRIRQQQILWFWNIHVKE